MSNPPFTPDNFHRAVPSDDDRERLLCRDCGYVAYENPKIIAGAVITSGDKILLCKRNINPQRGKWTIPAGFLEMSESPEEGAARETYEEARAKIKITDLLAIYSVRRISQVHMMYRAELVGDHFEPGPESQEVGLFEWSEIPWDQLAFPSVHWVLNHFDEVRGQRQFAPFTNPKGWETI